MPSFNKVIFAGHMTRDPQLKTLSNQTSVCEFGLACNRKFKTASGEEREEVTFIDCACFGKAGEVINQYAQKGKALLVDGRLKFDSWDDRNGGGKRSKLSVVVENFQFLGSRSGGDETSQEQQYPRNKQTARSRPQPEPPFGEEQEIDPSEIPF